MSDPVIPLAKERRENLVTFIQGLERALAEAKTPQERRQLGRHKQQVQKAIQALGNSVKRRPGFASLFVEEARKQLPRAAFDAIWEATRQCFKERETAYAVQRAAGRSDT